MATCLVTKLKENVTNDNLNKLGILTIKTSALSSVSNVSQQCALVISSVQPFNISVIGDGYFGTTPTTIESEHLTTLDKNAGYHDLYFSNGTYKIEITNKYNFLNVLFGTSYNNSRKLFSLNIDDLGYTNIVNLEISNSKSTGNIANLHNTSSFVKYRMSDTNVINDVAYFSNMTNLQRISINNAIGNIDSLSGMTNLTEVEMIGSVTGNIGSFASSANITNLDVMSTSIAGDISGISSLIKLAILWPGKANGTLESLCEGMVTAGRISGTLSYHGNSIITYNGSSAQSCTITFDSSLPNGYSVSVN